MSVKIKKVSQLSNKQTISKQTTEMIKRIILDTAKKQKPQNTAQLIELAQQKTAASKEQITQLLIQLENQDLLHFTRQPTTPSTLQKFILSKQAAWYWITIGISMTATMAAFIIPINSYPTTYLRSATSVILILFLPGFSLIKTLYPSQLPIKTNSQNLDAIERLALSICLSLSLVAILALILNYSPWGITLTPITLSLLGLTVAFATAAIIREHQTKVAT